MLLAMVTESRREDRSGCPEQQRIKTDSTATAELLQKKTNSFEFIHGFRSRGLLNMHESFSKFMIVPFSSLNEMPKSRISTSTPTGIALARDSQRDQRCFRVPSPSSSTAPFPRARLA